MPVTNGHDAHRGIRDRDELEKRDDRAVEDLHRLGGDDQ